MRSTASDRSASTSRRASKRHLASRTATSCARCSPLSAAQSRGSRRYGHTTENLRQDRALRALRAAELAARTGALDDAMTPLITRRDPDARGYFGEFGGRYVPETLVEPIEQLERAYFQVRDDAEFAGELAQLLKHYVGRPTPLYEARRLAKEYGGPRIFLKREDPN